MNTLAEWRKKANLSQGSLADEAGCSQAYICQLEQGSRSEPGLTIGRSIVRVLNEHGASCGLDDVFPDRRDDQAA